MGGEIIVNFKDHEGWLDHFYRIRINSVKVHLLDKNTPPALYQSPDHTVIGFRIYFPVEYKDSIDPDNVYSFWTALKHSCTSSYSYIDEQLTEGAPCEVSEEFDGVNHQTSHDGMFKIQAMEISQEILDGTYVDIGNKHDILIELATLQK